MRGAKKKKKCGKFKSGNNDVAFRHYDKSTQKNATQKDLAAKRS
jgi:hypothetical protein